MVVKDVFKMEELSKDLSTLGENIPCLKNTEFGSVNGPLQLTMENTTLKYPNHMLFAKHRQTKMIIMNEVFADDFKNSGYDALWMEWWIQEMQRGTGALALEVVMNISMASNIIVNRNTKIISRCSRIRNMELTYL